MKHVLNCSIPGTKDKIRPPAAFLLPLTATQRHTGSSAQTATSSKGVRSPTPPGTLFEPMAPLQQDPQLTFTPKSGEVELQMAPILAAANMASTACALLGR